MICPDLVSNLKGFLPEKDGARINFNIRVILCADKNNIFTVVLFSRRGNNFAVVFFAYNCYRLKAGVNVLQHKTIISIAMQTVIHTGRLRTDTSL